MQPACLGAKRPAALSWQGRKNHSRYSTGETAPPNIWSGHFQVLWATPSHSPAWRGGGLRLAYSRKHIGIHCLGVSGRHLPPHSQSLSPTSHPSCNCITSLQQTLQLSVRHRDQPWAAFRIFGQDCKIFYHQFPLPAKAKTPLPAPMHSAGTKAASRGQRAQWHPVLGWMAKDAAEMQAGATGLLST